ncbi:hypothetical protein GQ41_3642 [Arenibacter algicola]|uniref:Uracil DNA glycosylase superfamily protein n=1 Tax=Arenibacter algicola TaxID=616991 RepID=A0ABY3AEA2_9FLAO
MDAQIIDHISKEYNEKTISDGIVNHESYNNAEKKILWILKEPNSRNEPGSWDMREAISDKLKTESGILSGWQNTFTNIVYVTYGILKNKSWEEIPFINKEPQIIDELKKIAYINVKKTAGSAKTKPSVLKDYYVRSKEILLEQIKTIDPDILIFGGTFYLFKDDLGLSELNSYDSCNALKVNNKIYVNAFHPQYFGITREKYFKDILNAIQIEQTS